MRTIFIITCLLLFGSMGLTQSTDSAADEVYRIRIYNKIGGLVQVSMDSGQSCRTVGRVTVAANARITGFAASSYTPQGTVAATAVHGLRIKTGQSAQGIGKAQIPLIFSIIPAEFAQTPRGFGGHIARSSGIHTDIYTGHAIFRNQSPYVGNSVFVERGHSLLALPEDYIPVEGETFVIVVKRPSRMPSEIEFENHAEGNVTVKYPDGASDVITHVVRPVQGIGRYDGTTFTGVGKINTNHGGVLTISTAPICPPGTREGGEIETRGGFMIQPYFHAYQQGEASPQVMVIGPIDKSKPSMEGTPPLFGGYINLSCYNGRLVNSYRVQVKIDGGEWENMPQIVGRVDNAFKPEYLNAYFSKSGANRQIKNGVTAVKLLFPDYDPKLVADDLAQEESRYTARAVKSGVKTIKGVIKAAPSKLLRGIKMVDYYVDGCFIYSSNEFPYSYNWDSAKHSNSFHSLQVETTFDSGRDPIIETRHVLIAN